MTELTNWLLFWRKQNCENWQILKFDIACKMISVAKAIFSGQKRQGILVLFQGPILIKIYTLGQTYKLVLNNKMCIILDYMFSIFGQ
jgi:hypothetical protein